ncbi:MAG: hypothetical protein HeimC3_03010 [Candidatus Heimdallarchaeota archaeon LC_3]|nr:MAG: hypothetical protein HeimC3_03010 [Candidatus Heimdallarchaeota archaeon LC_3]
MENIEIPSAMPMELYSLQDLIRWLVSSSQGQQATIFYFQKDDKHFYATLIILPGYYNFKGLPLLLYVEHDSNPKSNFIRFDIRKESAESAITFTEGFDDRDSNLGYIQYIPIVQLKTIPHIFRFEKK